MKLQFQYLYERIWAPLKKWTSRIVQQIWRNDKDDDRFDHPYAIL